MAFSKKNIYDTIRTVDGSGITSDTQWFAVGSALTHQARIVKVKNLTDRNLFFAWNANATVGTASIANTQFVIAANSGEVLDITANKTGLNQGFFGGLGDRLYVRRSVAGEAPTGGVYLEICYGKDE